MKIILTNSKVEMQESMPSGTEVEIFPDFVNSDHPKSEGWYISNAGYLRTNPTYVGKDGVSDLMPVFGYSKIKITGAVGNQYWASWAFFTDAEDMVGSNSAVFRTAGDYEVDIPAGAVWVRFSQNGNSSGNVSPCRRFMIVK